MKRRKFLEILGLTSAGFLVHSQSKASKISLRSIAAEKPVVISTWNHGMAANKEAWKILNLGGNALDAVEKGVRVTESDPENHSVGLGGLPDSSGHVTLDACIMNHLNQCGSVACIQNIEHPISVARKVMEDTPHVLLVGKGAEEFAYSKGFQKTDLLTPKAKKIYEEWKKQQNQKKPIINHENHDTIGMLALDQYGDLSGACTTSGWAYKIPGRVGDSPIIGAGLFVDNEVGAACATGLGEAVIRIAGSHTVVELMRQGHSPEEACQLAVQRIIRKHSDLTGVQVGFIALNRKGEYGGYSVYNGFNYALHTTHKEELIDAHFDRKWD